MIEHFYAESSNGCQYHARLDTYDGRTHLEIFGRCDSTCEWRYVFTGQYIYRRDAVYQMQLFAPNWSEQPL